MNETTCAHRIIYESKRMRKIDSLAERSSNTVNVKHKHKKK